MNSLLLIILPVSLFYLKSSLFWVVCGILIAYLVASAFLALELISHFKKLFPKRGNHIDLSNVNGSIINFSVISLVNLFLFWGIILILGLFAAADDVAFFKIAISWFSAIGILIPFSTQILFSSVIIFKAKNDVKRLEKYLNTVMKYSAVVILPMIAGIFFFGDDLIRLIYGSEFIEAGLALKFIVFALFFQFVSNLFSSTLIAYGKIKNTTKIYVLNFLFGILFSFAIISCLSGFGLELMGACLSFLLLNVLLMSSLMVKASRFLDFDVKGAVAKPLFSSALMTLAIFYLNRYAISISNALLIIIISAVFYFVVMFLIKGITREDLRLIRHIGD
jgi:O-antigen/teichoic acid export membrane protein